MKKPDLKIPKMTGRIPLVEPRKKAQMVDFLGLWSLSDKKSERLMAEYIAKIITGYPLARKK